MDNLGEVPLSFEDVFNFITNDLPDCEDITKDNLKQPTSELVQKLYFKILIEMGLNESGLLGDQVDFETLSEIGEEVDLFKHMLPIMSLQSAIVNILTQIGGGTNFGLSDLINPSAKRTLKFLSMMLNFYTFCSGQFNEVERVGAAVDSLVKEKEDKIAAIERYRTSNNIEASKACEEKSLLATTKEDIEILNNKMQDLLTEQNALLEVKDRLKKELEAANLQTQDVEEEIKVLEKEKDNLQVAIDGAAAIAKFDEEIARLNEDVESKRMKIVETKASIGQVDSASQILRSILEVLSNYAEEKSSTTDWNNKIQSINRQIQALHSENDEMSTLVRDEESLVREKSEALGKLKAQWFRRRQGKEEDLNRVEKELEEAKSSLNEEQDKSLRLRNDIRKVSKECEVEEASLVKESNQVRTQYTILLETIEKFNLKFSNTMAKLA